MTSVKIGIEDVLATVDYILAVVLEDNTLRFLGQGLKFRQNPLHPVGWKKISTAEGYAKTAETTRLLRDFRVTEIRVCERRADYQCLSSIAILKQLNGGRKEQDHVTR